MNGAIDEFEKAAQGRAIARKLDIRRQRQTWDGADEGYYSEADSEAWLSGFWNPGTPFRALFDCINHSNIVELACGHGRHSWQMRDWDNQKTLVDFLESNIAFCKKRFSGYKNVKFIVNNGRDLSEIKNDSATGLFSYDAMVHFHHTIVSSYIVEIARILVGLTLTFASPG